MQKRTPKMVYADAKGNIFDHPELCMAGMNGTLSVLPDDVDWKVGLGDWLDARTDQVLPSQTALIA